MSIEMNSVHLIFKPAPLAPRGFILHQCQSAKSFILKTGSQLNRGLLRNIERVDYVNIKQQLNLIFKDFSSYGTKIDTIIPPKNVSTKLQRSQQCKGIRAQLETERYDT
ncbi:hypothetical protein L596_017318 [Steinernema carpocapsae]|uniref:Uncharacterized protein n=1 Tax=Steinernema carpocapsae TaxID=34508 RepID=A0A4U5N1A2_STECR|nr:hypothetical protein L596_017318 [Steinernema carpocapsae]